MSQVMVSDCMGTFLMSRLPSTFSSEPFRNEPLFSFSLDTERVVSFAWIIVHLDEISVRFWETATLIRSLRLSVSVQKFGIYTYIPVECSIDVHSI
jgi:hypothetical protein